MNIGVSTTALFVAQGGRCFYCGEEFSCGPYRPNKRPKGYTVDHFFPLSRGYKITDGKVLSCHPCNQAKDDRLPTAEEVRRFEVAFRVTLACREAA